MFGWYGVRAPDGPTQLRFSRTGSGRTRDTRLVVSRMAAVVLEAKSSTPTTGLVKVPTTPFPIPVNRPCVRKEGREERGRERRDSDHFKISYHSHHT